MNRKSLAGLILLNAVLLITLALVSMTPQTAQAQADRRRGEYIMVTGTISGAPYEIVYIYDTSNQQLLPVAFDGRGMKILTATRDVASDQSRIGGDR